MSTIHKDIYGPQGKLFQMLHRMKTLKLSLLFDDLTHMEFVTLDTLEKIHNQSHTNRMKISEIAKVTGVCSSAASRTLNGLENKGLIRRVSDSADRRNTYAELTDKGQAVLSECQKTMDDFMEDVFERIGENDINRFLNILDKIYQVSLDELETRTKTKE